MPKIKVKVTMDCAATRANASALSRRFSYPAIRDGVDVLFPGAVLGISDVCRYFHSFPWSVPMRRIMRIRWEGKTYKCLALCFGFTACLYYCNALSEEFRRWVKQHLGDCAHMEDDWLNVGVSIDDIREKR